MSASISQNSNFQSNDPYVRLSLRITVTAPAVLMGVSLILLQRSDTGGTPAAATLPLAMVFNATAGRWEQAVQDGPTAPFYRYQIRLTYADSSTTDSNVGTLYTGGAQVGNIQVKACSGQTLYATATNPLGQWFNTGTGVYESETDANWLQYVIPLSEAAPGSGIYIGSVPQQTGHGLSFLAIRSQAGLSPAPSDLQYRGEGVEPLVLALDWNGRSVNSLAPLGQWMNSQVALPEQNAGNSLSKAAKILEALYDARAKLACKSVLSVQIDGTGTTFYSPGQADAAITFWQRQVALLSGTRRRVIPLNI